jgi:hypothetical protein
MLCKKFEVIFLKNFFIKINGDYYSGMKEFNNDPALITVTKDFEQAKICEGFVNLKSHWERIYNAMKNNNAPVDKIEIKVVN